MQVSYCDICEELIKPCETIFLLGITHLKEQEIDKPKAVNYFSESLRNNIEYEKINIFEVCDGCKKLIEQILTLKRAKLQKTKEELNQMWKIKTKKKKNKGVNNGRI